MVVGENAHFYAPATKAVLGAGCVGPQGIVALGGGAAHVQGWLVGRMNCNDGTLSSVDDLSTGNRPDISAPWALPRRKPLAYESASSCFALSVVASACTTT